MKYLEKLTPTEMITDAKKNFLDIVTKILIFILRVFFLAFFFIFFCFCLLQDEIFWAKKRKRKCGKKNCFVTL